MKSLLSLSLLLTSLGLLAQDKSTVYPRLTVFPNSAQVNIYNGNEYDVQCSGQVYLYTRSGRMRSHYLHRYVRARSQAFERIPNYQYNDPYRNGHHSIYCREIR